MLEGTSTDSAFPLLLLSIDWPPTAYQTLAVHPLVCAQSATSVSHRCPAKTVHIGSPCNLRIKARFIIAFASASNQHPQLVAASLSLSLFNPSSLYFPYLFPFISNFFSPIFPIFFHLSVLRLLLYLCLLEASAKSYSTRLLFPETQLSESLDPLQSGIEKEKEKKENKKRRYGCSGHQKECQNSSSNSSDDRWQLYLFQRSC